MASFNSYNISKMYNKNPMMIYSGRVNIFFMNSSQLHTILVLLNWLQKTEN